MTFEAVVSDPLAFGHHVFGVFGLQSLDLASSALGLNFVGCRNVAEMGIVF